MATLATRFRIDRMARVWSWLRRRDGLQQILIVVGGVATAISVLTIVVTGNHFILDAVGGMLVTAIGLMAASWGQPRKDRAILATATRGGAVR